MSYTTTRGDASVTASEAIIRGIAPNGGLYVPREIPEIPFNEEMINMNYEDIAALVMSPFLDDFTDDEIRLCVQNAYGAGFDCPETAPVANKNGVYFLELFHGRTLAFKDMALSILPHLMRVAQKKHNISSEIVILTATSGDTGKAALAGFADVPGFKITVFYPKDGVSEVQRLQMVTQTGANTQVIAVEGNFDDAQTGVKKIFADKEFAERLERAGYVLSSANSINIGRLVPQIAYYYYAYAQLCKNSEITHGEMINFVVPTGNFGNILAAYYAKKMGLPVKTLVCASNSNKILYDFFTTHEYNINREFILTASPSMDILISSNLERLLYDLTQNGGTVKGLIDSLSSKGVYYFDPDGSSIRPGYASEQETFDAIKQMHGMGYLIDTHTAVAYAVYKKTLNELTKTVIVSTASPYKFGADVCRAVTGESYDGYTPHELFSRVERLSGTPVPDVIQGLDSLPILHNSVCKKDDMKETLESFLLTSEGRKA